MRDLPARTVTPAEHAVMEDLCTRAIEEAARDDGKAGIAAAVMRGDRVIARGVNEVHLSHDPTRHAEIVAMSAAARALRDSDLTGCTLLSTLQPCEMCLAAMRFAGIDRVIFAGQKPHVDRDKYFVFPSLTLEDFDAADPEGFTAIGGLREEWVAHIYAAGDD